MTLLSLDAISTLPQHPHYHHTLLTHTLTKHPGTPITPYQPIPSPHPLNLPSHPALLTHIILPTHPVNPPSPRQPILPTHLITTSRVTPETPLQQVRRQVKEWDIIALSHQRMNHAREEEEREQREQEKAQRHQQRQEQRAREKEERARGKEWGRLGTHTLSIYPININAPCR